MTKALFPFVFSIFRGNRSVTSHEDKHIYIAHSSSLEKHTQIYTTHSHKGISLTDIHTTSQQLTMDAQKEGREIGDWERD